MKRSIFTIISIIISLTINAQTLEHQHTGRTGTCHQVDYNEYVYLISDGTNHTSIYSIDHNLLKSVTLTPGATDYMSLHISKKLYNNDSKYEITYLYRKGGFYFEVMDDDGIVLLKDSFFTAYKFRNTNQGTKLLIECNLNPRVLKVYGLPGQIFTKIPEILDNNTSLSAFPNPASDAITIPITLPGKSNNGKLLIYNISGEEINCIPINQWINEIILNTSDFAPGTYLYHIVSDNHTSKTNKFIVK
jgi:hypothetical protein